MDGNTIARCTTLRTTNHMSRLTHVLGTHVSALCAPPYVVSFIFSLNKQSFDPPNSQSVSHSVHAPIFWKHLKYDGGRLSDIEHTLRKEHLYVKHEEAGPGVGLLSRWRAMMEFNLIECKNNKEIECESPELLIRPVALSRVRRWMRTQWLGRHGVGIEMHAQYSKSYIPHSPQPETVTTIDATTINQNMYITLLWL